jgi:hypothetical protein
MGNAIVKALKDRKFVITGIIFVISALGIQTTAQYMKLHFRKQYLPLKKSLREFDAKKLYPPYKEVKKEQMTSDMEEALGTKEYTQIVLEDTEAVEEESFGKFFNLFVTYYSGDPDQVPHVPDVCYIGGGYDPAGDSNTTVTVPGLGLKNDELPVRVLFFKNSRDFIPRYQTVVYFFSVNGKFVEDRTSVRWYLGDIRYKYAYFSKVELSFHTQGSPPKVEAVLKSSTKILRKILPILVREHWADWKEVIKNNK